MNFTPAFMKDAIERDGCKHGHDPRNHIGVSCGVSWAEVYQTWDDIWFHDSYDHEIFRKILRGEINASN